MTDTTALAPIWTPSPERLHDAHLTRFTLWLSQNLGLQFKTYDALWEWSTTEIEEFWNAIWQYFGVVGTRSSLPVLINSGMPNVRWFPECTLNYVNQVFRMASDARSAVVYSDEEGAWTELSYLELHRQTAALAHTLREFGVGKGDRVAAYLGNTPEAIVAFLATASVGAIWSLCAPEMGVQAVLDRFRQIEPKVLISTSGYRWAGKAYDRRVAVTSLLEGLPTLKGVVIKEDIDGLPDTVPRISWAQASDGDHPLIVEDVDFEHPLWILYSSGTTGLPKAIVHGHGGVVLEHLKWLGLHSDLREGDRYFWYSSTGWMVWNAAVGGLLLGTTVCLYEGSPNWPDNSVLWKYVEACRASFFGAGASYFSNLQKTGFRPRQVANTSLIRSLTAAGSPISADGFRWFYEEVNHDLFFCPASGGTDIASAFVGSVPSLPIYAGQMQGPCLGARVEAWNEAGKSVVDEVGELVCTRPMPSMPLYFWNDQDNARYRASYFEKFPEVWTHGDWLRLTPQGGAIIYGRSDATVNRKGVRAGTSEYYRVLEDLPEIADSLVVDLQLLGREAHLIVFLVLKGSSALTSALEAKVRTKVREAISPRHVPDMIFSVPEIPRTLTGKKLEVPVRKILLGIPASEVANPAGVANPGSLEWFVQFARETLEGNASTRSSKSEK